MDKTETSGPEMIAGILTGLIKIGFYLLLGAAALKYLLSWPCQLSRPRRSRVARRATTELPTPASPSSASTGIP